jgi:superfamily II DNA/RNA helicase
MLDMGFKPAVSRIVAQTPDDRQTLFFSATLEGATGKLAAAYTHKARRHTQESTEQEDRDIEHSFVHVESQSAKLDHLTVQLKDADRGRTLVFVRTKRGADRLVKRLRSREVEAVAMHGDKSQGQRERALARFEKGEVDTLIATDVAARGIDVADVTHVINFDAPGDQDAYTHRIGRTGRAGARGAGISFVLSDQVGEMSRIARDLGLAREFDRGRPAGSPRTETASTPRPSSNSNSNGNASAAQKRRRRRRRSKAKVAA